METKLRLLFLPNKIFFKILGNKFCQLKKSSYLSRMEKIQYFIETQTALTAVDFLREAVAYFNHRAERRNDSKAVDQLLTDYMYYLIGGQR